MELKKDPRCYTDVCIDGRWFHHDHCTTRVYMLKGGAECELELAKTPSTEDELVHLITQQQT